MTSPGSRKLDGRVAIITGAGRGIGRAYALAFAEHGARLVLNAHLPGPTGAVEGSSADGVAEEIRRAGGEAVAHVGSISDWDIGRGLVDLAIGTYGRLDVLVNNAGFLRDSLLVNMSEQDWDAVVAVHLKGQFVPLRFAAHHWRERSKAGEDLHASVINTTAGAGLHGNVGQANYGAAKAGAAALTIIAARELQRYGVHVNAVAPLARTRLLETVPALAELIKKPDDPAQFDAFDADNVAPLGVHLASTECRFTGRVFNVFGSKLGVWDGWRINDRFERPGRWTIDEVRDALNALPADPPEFDPT